MKKRLSVLLLATVFSVLAGCGDSSQTSQPGASSEITSEDTRTEAELLTILDEVAEFTPLLLESGTGERLDSTQFLSVNELKDGRDLLGVRSINYWGDNITVRWEAREASTLAGFAITELDPTTMQIRPEYPEYEPKTDPQGNDISVIPPIATAQLYAHLTLGKVTKRVTYNMWLYPQMKVNWKDLSVVRDSLPNEIIGVRGYITSIYPDYDALTIQDGHYALTLFKVQNYSSAGLEIGDYVESVGSWRPYNGLAEIGYIKRLNKANPEEFGAKLPIVHEFTAAAFKEWYDAGSDVAEQFKTALYDLDSARVKMTEPLTLVRAEDRDRKEIALSELPVGPTHANVIVTGEVEGEIVEIKLSLSYHIGTEAQQAIKDKLIAAGIGAQLTFDGILSWYNEPVLGPMTADDIIIL